MAVTSSPKREPAARTRVQTRSQANDNKTHQQPPPKQEKKSKVTPASKAAPKAATKSSAKEAEAKPLSDAEVEQYIQNAFAQRYHDVDGNLKEVPEVNTFSQELEKELRGHSDIISRVVKSIDIKLANKHLSNKRFSKLLTQAQQECDKLTWSNSTRALDRAVVIKALAKQNPSIHLTRIEIVARKAEELRRSSESVGSEIATTMKEPDKKKSKETASSKPAPEPKETIDQWVWGQFETHGFGVIGFKGYKWLTSYLQEQKPDEASQIAQSVKKLQIDLKAQGQDVNEMALKRKAGIPIKSDTSQTKSAMPTAKLASKDASNASVLAMVTTDNFMDLFPGSFPSVPMNGKSDISAAVNHTPPPVHNDEAPRTDLLARKMNQFNLADRPKSSAKNDQYHGGIRFNDSGVDVPSYEGSVDGGIATNSGSVTAAVDHDDMDALLSDSSEEDDDEDVTDEFDAEIQHAPLLDEDFISEDSSHLVPQYGLIGSHDEFADGKSRLFLNTNIPFSAFICGVQGSGKSHTTSCIMENALIPSKNLGKLQNPLSALVFSYGHFSGDGEGYTISEAAFLAAPHPKMPGGAHVKKVTVLVSPSNYIRISKLYLRVPNVTVIPFMLKPKHLDIDIMLTLMNVSESDAPPLYMAQVTQILREMASAGGPFNYIAFRATLKQQKFNPAQENMLQMRLNLLESFLDLKGTCPEPQFKPGEITIMDMSCPFIDPNTACILFRIGLQRYLQSDSPGKMIVLDEAHKYMLPVPGAKALNEALLQTIRLQRHFGARVIISTQEPTLLTDLIALCSIAFIHRFSSPEWLSAIKKHIPMSAQAANTLMNKIEGLKTGNALVYSSNALLGWNEDDKPIKGAGKILKVNIRKRITSDGGQSVLAV